MTFDDLSLPQIFAGLRDGRLDRGAVQAWARGLEGYLTPRPCDQEALFALTVVAEKVRGEWFFDAAALSLWVDMLERYPLEWPLRDGWVCAPHTPWPKRRGLLLGFFEPEGSVAACLGVPVKSWWDLDKYEAWWVRAPSGLRFSVHRYVPSHVDAGAWFELTTCGEGLDGTDDARRLAALRIFDTLCSLKLPAAPYRGEPIVPQWALWRTDDHGRDFHVSDHLTEASATRARVRRSRTVHKQWFWTAPQRGSGQR